MFSKISQSWYQNFPNDQITPYVLEYFFKATAININQLQLHESLQVQF